MRAESDEILLESFRCGNDLAFVNLYNRHKQSIHIFCLKMVADPSGAEDIVQDVFFKLYERKDQIIKSDRLKSWLYAIARNECLSHLQKIKKFPHSRIDFQTEVPGYHSPADFEIADEIRHLSDAIAGLSDDLREVLLLRLYDDLSYREISEIIHQKESVVKSRLFEARKKLHKQLNPVYSERNQT